MGITAKRLRELVIYDPATGWFVSRVGRPGVSCGAVMGSFNKALGYWQVGLDGGKHYGHRMAWLYVHGNLRSEIDHISGDGADNRICNLREASSSQNKCNAKRRCDNASGYKGVSLYSPGRWRATIKKKGRETVVGFFASPAEAYTARLKLLPAIHGEFARAQ